MKVMKMFFSSLMSVLPPSCHCCTRVLLTLNLKSFACICSLWMQHLIWACWPCYDGNTNCINDLGLLKSIDPEPYIISVISIFCTYGYLQYWNRSLDSPLERYPV
jgi:hypothetical protein